MLLPISRELGMVVVPLLLCLFGVLVLRKATVESVTFDRLRGKLILARFSVLRCTSKHTEINLARISKVCAVRRGLLKAKMDMRYFALIIELDNGQRATVLETKRLSRIQKELMCIRKFLGIQDLDLAVIDETKLWREHLDKARQQQPT